jgi:SecD/SecF fusion protein
VAGVLVLQRGGGADSGSASAGPDDPALDAKMRRLAFYDWESKVIGPDGRPAPGDPAVTGGPDAGGAGSLSLYDAVLRAAARPGRAEPDNARTTTLYYAVDRAHRRVFGRGAPSREQAVAAVPAAERRGVRVHEVKPDTAIVAATGAADRWYVLDDDVALRGSEIRDPRRTRDPASGQEAILFSFTEPGRARFKALTQAIARRGAASSLERVHDDPQLHNQHFAVVYDGKLVTIPFVDFRRNPDGLDASAGSQLLARLP